MTLRELIGIHPSIQTYLVGQGFALFSAHQPLRLFQINLENNFRFNNFSRTLFTFASFVLISPIFYMSLLFLYFWWFLEHFFLFFSFPYLYCIVSLPRPRWIPIYTPLSTSLRRSQMFLKNLFLHFPCLKKYFSSHIPLFFRDVYVRGAVEIYIYTFMEKVRIYSLHTS
jgi:hypothetical protein